jgi:ABC-type ATPase involved in cell division
MIGRPLCRGREVEFCIALAAFANIFDKSLKASRLPQSVTTVRFLRIGENQSVQLARGIIAKPELVTG